MPRRIQVLLVAALAGASLAAAGAAEAAVYHGTVGPRATITLKNARGERVTRVPVGRHTFVIHDNSTTHNFVLARGTRVLRATSVDGRGVSRWRGVRITAGRYAYYCATHPSTMRKTFRAR